MKNPIAFCGLDCSSCPAYIATQNNDLEGLQRTAETWARELKLPITPEDCICNGCQPREGARLGGYCNECPIRACGIKNGYPNCAYCPDYPCADLSRFHQGASMAKDSLEAIRRQMARD